jgi:hypothetical protein
VQPARIVVSINYKVLSQEYDDQVFSVAPKWTLAAVSSQQLTPPGSTFTALPTFIKAPPRACQADTYHSKRYAAAHRWSSCPGIILGPISLFRRIWSVTGLAAAVIANVVRIGFLGYGFFKLVEPAFF